MRCVFHLRLGLILVYASSCRYCIRDGHARAGDGEPTCFSKLAILWGPPILCFGVGGCFRFGPPTWGGAEVKWPEPLAKFSLLHCWALASHLGGWSFGAGLVFGLWVRFRAQSGCSPGLGSSARCTQRTAQRRRFLWADR